MLGHRTRTSESVLPSPPRRVQEYQKTSEPPNHQQQYVTADETHPSTRHNSGHPLDAAELSRPVGFSRDNVPIGHPMDAAELHEKFSKGQKK